MRDAQMRRLNMELISFLRRPGRQTLTKKQWRRRPYVCLWMSNILCFAILQKASLCTDRWPMQEILFLLRSSSNELFEGHNCPDSPDWDPSRHAWLCPILLIDKFPLKTHVCITSRFWHPHKIQGPGDLWIFQPNVLRGAADTVCAVELLREPNRPSKYI